MTKPEDPCLSAGALAWLVLKKAIRTALILALLGGLLYGTFFSMVLTVERPAWLPEVAWLRYLYGFAACALPGINLGAISGFAFGLIAALFQVRKAQREAVLRQLS